MAEVLKARDITRPHGSLIAVKRILPHLTDDRQYVTMFQDESRVLAKLEHDNIIRTLEVGQVGGTPFIALEYVWGQDARMLFHRARRSDHPIPVPIACFIITQVCAALHHAHETRDAYGHALGLVHRDVSLQNVLISYDGAVKLTDFGIAMSAENHARTEVGVVKGKFGYMSPEQIRGEPLDRRSDVFATGICLYELLTCERLFSGESDYAAIEKVRTVNIEPPSRLNREVPSTLELIVMKALAKHPRDRYQTAGELRRALLAFMSESGGECSAADLARSMRDVFADELRKQPSPDAIDAGDRLPKDEGTGLAAFDHLDPVSALTAASAVHVAPEPAAPQPVLPSSMSQARASASQRRSSHPAPSVPPAVPRRESVPAPNSDVFPRSQPGFGAPHVQASAPGALGSQPAAELGLEWDEDEMATATERVEGVQPLAELPEVASGDDDVTRQLYVGETFSGVAAGFSGVRPSSHPAPAAGPAHASSAPPAARFERAVSTVPPVQDAEYVLPQTSYGVVVSVVLGIIAVISGALYITRGGRGAEVHLPTSPADAQVLVDGQQPPGDESPFVIRDLAPAMQHEIRVSKSGYRTWSTRISLESGQVLELPLVSLVPLPQAAAPAAPAAELAAEQAPAAQAAPEQRPTEPETAAPRPAPEPERQSAPEPERTHQRAHHRRPARAHRRSQRHAAATTANHGAAAVTGSGTLRINSRPWSEVAVDGRAVGNTPLMNLSLSAGTHRVRMRNPQFGLEKTIKVRIAAGEVVTKVVDLQ